MAIKLIIFDLDGPILDSFERCKKSVIEGVKRLIQAERADPKKIIPSKESFIKCLGYPGTKSAKLMFPTLAKRDLETIINCWKENELKRKIPLVKGALKTLKFLKKKKYFSCLLTSRSNNLSFHLKNYNLEKLFDFVQSWKNPQIKPKKIHKRHLFTNYHKPDPKVLNSILKWASRKEISKTEILMIDDTIIGLETAKNSNISFLGVCTGPLDSKRAWQKYGNLDGKYVIKSIAKLPKWLEKYSGARSSVVVAQTL